MPSGVTVCIHVHVLLLVCVCVLCVVCCFLVTEFINLLQQAALHEDLASSQLLRSSEVDLCSETATHHWYNTPPPPTHVCTQTRVYMFQYSTC